MLSPFQQNLVDLGLLGLGVYFFVQLARGTAGYLLFRRLRRTAVLTWPAPPPAKLPWLFGLGVLGAVTAVVNVSRQRPPHQIVGLVLMAVYFLGLVPMVRGIRLGIYRDGVWAHRGFLRWESVSRIAFVESPQIVLLLQSRHERASFKLPVPAEEYGTVRKLLAERARDGAMRLDPAILGLS